MYDLAVNLPKTRFEPVVMFGGEGDLKRKLEAAGVRTVTVKGLSRDISAWGELLVFARILRHIRGIRPDILHINSSKAGGIGSLAGRILRVPNIIFTAHGWAFNEDRGALSKLLIAAASWLTILLSHNTIAVSRKDFLQGSRFPFTKNKITLIHNGIPEISFVNKEEARARITGNENIRNEDEKETLWIGAVGELTKNKGFPYLIRAVGDMAKRKKNTRPCKLFVIGAGEDFEKLSRLIAREGAEDLVFLAGYRENANSLLRAFDIFVIPSVKEGLPYILLEAGRARLPVIATEVGGIPEVIDDMVSGILVQPQNARELTEALEFLAAHDDRRREFGEMLSETIAKRFSLRKMLEKTVSLYRAP